MIKIMPGRLVMPLPAGNLAVIKDDQSSGAAIFKNTKRIDGGPSGLIRQYSFPVLLGPTSTLLAGFRWYLPANASAHGPALDHHLFLNLWIALSLLALVHLVLLIGLLSRRRTSGPGRIWAVEYLPVLFLGLLFATLTVQAEILWASSRYTGADPAALQAEVTGMQFAWYFRYPGSDAVFGRTEPRLSAPGEGNPLGIDPADQHGTDDIVVSELVLPADRPVDLRLRAQDVIHGFAVPEMRLKQNAVPGEIIHLHFTPTTPGIYAILCTQLCGSGHYRMAANLRVVTPGEYSTWLASKQPIHQSGATP